MTSKIQILGIRKGKDRFGREFTSTNNFFKEGWRAEDVPSLFQQVDYLMEEVIPKDDQENLFYTVANCLEEKGRKFSHQSVLPFDIDGMPEDLTDEEKDAYIKVICSALKVHSSNVGIVWSGHGLHFLIGLAKPITHLGYFEETRKYYKALVGHINQTLFDSGLQGSADPTAWGPGKLMRLPNTLNIKEGKKAVECYLINSNIMLLDYDFCKISTLPIVEDHDQIREETFSNYPVPDPEGVLEGCPFIQWAKDFPNEVSEPQWYAFLSIVGRLPEGNQLCHDYSEGHEKYDFKSTERKIVQALEASGPRTCVNVKNLWDGCTQCEHWSNIVSPITLKSPNYIRTKDTGFRKVILDSRGKPKASTIDFEDLRKYYEQTHRYVTINGVKSILLWNGKYWMDTESKVSSESPESFCQDNVFPAPKNADCKEFRALLERTNVVNSDMFQDTTFQKMNFQNGVLDLQNFEFKPHDPKVGFTHVLPYDYDPHAESPIFEKFMQEVTCGDLDKINLLLEFAGYAFSNGPCQPARALILVGSGANGKSTFTDILKMIAGDDAFSALSLSDLSKEVNRTSMMGKLFNISEETPRKALIESSTFKAVVSGGHITYRVLYKGVVTAQNRTKLIMSCNDLPSSEDSSHGLYRRMLIIPFEARFEEGKNADIHILDKIRKELPGVLNRIIEGYKRLVNAKKFTIPQEVEKTIEEYKEDNDPFISFCKDYLQVDDQAAEYISLDLIYNKYLDFVMEDRGIKTTVLARNHFTKKLKSYGPFKDQYDSKRKMVKGKLKTVIRGIKFIEDEKEEY